MTLREKLERMRDWAAKRPSLYCDTQNRDVVMLIDVALAAIQGNHAVAHKETDDALSRLDKELG